MALDSTAAFKARATEIGMRKQLLDKLVAGGVSTFGKLAFVCSATPNSGNEQALVDAVNAIVGSPLTAADLVDVRRLWFEASASMLSDLKTRTERTETDTPRSLPLAERLSRIAAQQARLPGIEIDVHLEPSYQLMDKISAMSDVQIVGYIPPNKCSSRAQELSSEKTETQLTFDSTGNLRSTKKAVDLEAAVTGELALREALQRRALAFDACALMTYEVGEKWASLLFRAMQKEPPLGHRYVTMHQALAADREVWQLLSQDTRGALRPLPDGKRPLDLAMQKRMYDPAVQVCIVPLPSGAAAAAKSAGSGVPKPTGEGQLSKSAAKRKRAKERKVAQQAEAKKAREAPPKSDSPPKGTGKGKKGNQPDLPTGCALKQGNDVFCANYNRGNCTFGAKCRFKHACYFVGCGKTRPYIECGH